MRKRCMLDNHSGPVCSCHDTATASFPLPSCFALTSCPPGMAVLGPAVGMGSVDPTPVASHTVGAEALEGELRTTVTHLQCLSITSGFLLKAW